MSAAETPLFPLRTVLFPGGYLPLRIFEQRYLTMIRDCVQTDSGFGICLIREGEEAVSPVRMTQIGTHAKIIDWHTLEDGLLGITGMGTERFRIDSVWQQEDGLYKAHVQVLDDPTGCPVPASHAILSDILNRFMEKVGDQYPGFTSDDLQDAVWVGYRLSELLPLSGIEKQHLLEMNDPLERLQKLMEIMPRFQKA
jgi:Lon protease-like protein